MSRAIHTELLRAYHSYSWTEAGRMSDSAADVLTLVRRSAPCEHVEMAVLEFLRALEVGIAHVHGGSYVEWALTKRLVWMAPQVQMMTVAAFAEPRVRFDPWAVAEAYATAGIRNETDQFLRIRRQFPLGLPLVPPCNRFIELRTGASFAKTLNGFCSLDSLLGALKADLSPRGWSSFIRFALRPQSETATLPLEFAPHEIMSRGDAPSNYFRDCFLGRLEPPPPREAFARLQILVRGGLARRIR